MNLLLPATTSASLINHVHHMDIFELCERVYRAGVQVDCILADLPYGTTACAWDEVIPFAPMWEAFRRVIKPRGAIVLTASQPFTSRLVNSNIKMFRYAWVWSKTRPSDSINANRRPLKIHEDVVVFSSGDTAYYPQMVVVPRVVEKERKVNKGAIVGNKQLTRKFDNNGLGYPRTIIEFANPNFDVVHPTQKPVDLFRYLIRTYTLPGQLVFDPCVGSGTTAVAAREEGRRFIVGDSGAEYVQVAIDRLAQPYTPSFLPALESA